MRSRIEAGPGLELHRRGSIHAHEAHWNRGAFLDGLTRKMRQRQYSERTEETYLGWIHRFLSYHGGRHPGALGIEDVQVFLRYLANERHLSAKSRNQAASALAFLFRVGLGIDVGGGKDGITRARGPQRRPTVLTRDEVKAVLAEMSGTTRLVAQLLYGSGLRLSEALHLRVKDVSLETRTLTVRDGKGSKDRETVIARRIAEALAAQIERTARLHDQDRRGGGGWARLPGALDRKSPAAGWELAWQHVFPASKESADPRTGRRGRWHLHPTAVQRAVRAAAKRTRIPKIITCHTLRHSFATHILRNGADPRTVQALMGHKSLRTTMIYLHPDLRTPGVVSPLDLLSDD
jgi:integron integrase